ncbi:hypothetical protein Goshw_010450 [Gossypium schwendimanii]|uniref:Uncharacterized protein n=1 Tax=Gossypium schwendimanii TaxID=34291 RepID=A0A7J9MAR9_GOSSC|nr:hypothetical protein [Gossypium schwendimanii]
MPTYAINAWRQNQLHLHHTFAAQLKARK